MGKWFGFCWGSAAFDPAGGTNTCCILLQVGRMTTKDKRQNAEEPNYDKVGRRQRQERTCTEKYANLGVPRNLHLMMKTCRNKDPKHIICHHQRSAILLETQRKIEEKFTPSVSDVYFC